MKKDDKLQIKQLFETKRKTLGFSYAQAAAAAGTKGSTISQVFNDKYAADDTGIYKLLARWVDYNVGWRVVDTVNFRFISRILEDSQVNAHAYAVVGAAGSGKTVTQKYYAANNKNAFLLRCDEFWNRKQFLQELMAQIGRDHNGMSISSMMNMITRHLLQLRNPLIMIDEADKLSNQVFQLFISLYNRLEDHCGLVMTATNHLAVRLERGLARNAKGYAEIWSRIGRKPVECAVIKTKDVKSICAANGVDDEHQIKLIAMEAEGDLRRVKRAVHKYHLATIE